jgi:hypothetical protein
MPGYIVKSHYYVLRDQRTGEPISYMGRYRFYDEDLDEITEFLREVRLDNPNWLLYRNCEIVTKQGYHFPN